MARAVSRTRSRCALVEILHRRPAIDAGQEEGRHEGRGAALDAVARLPGHAVEVGLGESRETGETRVPAILPQHALEEQVGQAEGQVEGGVAPAGAFGIEKHRPSRPVQDVLGTDVAMDQGEPCGERQCGEGLEPCGEVGMRARRRPEVGLDADRFEGRLVGELPRQPGLRRAAPVDRDERRPDRSREAGIGVTGHQFGFPDRVGVVRQVVHDEEAVLGGFRDQCRHGFWEPNVPPS